MKPEASSGGGGGDRPRYASHSGGSSSSSATSKEKVRCQSSFATSVHRSMSEPGFQTMEREVVKAYGNVAPPSPQNLGLVSPGVGILEGRGDVSGSGRKRPGRKTRRPDGYGGLSPENGFSTSFQIGRFLVAVHC